jgi:DNA-binding beta-propeller fold protein YncE
MTESRSVPWTALAIAAGILAWPPPAPAQAPAPVFLEATGQSFARPHDLVLAPDGRHLYVADVGNHVIKVLDPESLETVGAIGRGELDSPHDVAFDGAGRLLVADTGNDRIAVYAVEGAQGRLLETLDGAMGSPEGVAVGPDGTVYVTNAALDTVVAIAPDGTRRSAGRGGAGANEYRRPHDIAVGPDGRVYAVDPGNDRIQVLSPGLEPIAVVGGAAYGLDEAKYVAFDEAGRLYVADEYNNQVKILDRKRRPVAAIGTGERGMAPDRLNKPEGVEVRGGRVWVSDTYNNRILLYRFDGTD